MAFKMGDEVLTYQDNCLLADQEACKHFLLEDASVPEEETSCAQASRRSWRGVWGLTPQRIPA